MIELVGSKEVERHVEGERLGYECDVIFICMWTEMWMAMEMETEYLDERT